MEENDATERWLECIVELFLTIHVQTHHKKISRRPKTLISEVRSVVSKKEE